MVAIFYIKIETNIEHEMGSSNFYGHDYVNFSFFSKDVYIFYCISKYIDALPMGKGSGMVINDDPLKSSPSKHSRKDSGNKKVLATKGKILNSILICFKMVMIL